jgi:hypothetical protein
MLAEIQGIHIILKRWIENPGAPTSEISPFSADRDKNRPFTPEEIARMAGFLGRHAPTVRTSIDVQSRSSHCGLTLHDRTA